MEYFIHAILCLAQLIALRFIDKTRFIGTFLQETLVTLILFYILRRQEILNDTTFINFLELFENGYFLIQIIICSS